MYCNFKEKETLYYIEKLECYFDLGLGLKKLNNSPLTYKLYGVINKNNENDLITFFEILPSDKKIYIDMSCVYDINSLLYDDFLKLSKTHQKLKWINCNKKSKAILKRAKINRCQIK
jgi:hypothetical protein